MPILLRHLRYFVHVVDAGSFSRAATIAHVAQPALSQQIMAVEEEIGTTLLTRSARGVAPTEAGLVFYQQARSILRQVEEVPALVRAIGNEPTGLVSLGMPQSLAARVGTAFILACRERFPKVMLRIVEGSSVQLRESLTAGRIDISLMHEELEVPGLTHRPIFYQALYLIGPHDAEGPEGDVVTLADVAARPLLLPASPNVVRDTMDRTLSAAGLAPCLVAEIGGFHSLIAAVREGLGCTVLPWPGTGVPLHAGQLRAWQIALRMDITTSFTLSTLAPTSSAAFTIQEFFGRFLAERVRAECWAGARLAPGYRDSL